MRREPASLVKVGPGLVVVDAHLQPGEQVANVVGQGAEVVVAKVVEHRELVAAAGRRRGAQRPHESRVVVVAAFNPGLDARGDVAGHHERGDGKCDAQLVGPRREGENEAADDRAADDRQRERDLQLGARGDSSVLEAQIGSGGVCMLAWTRKAPA